MRGLVYKDIVVFFRSIDRRSFLIVGGTILLLLFNAGSYAGLLSSIMLAISTGIQNLLCFESDEKAGWGKYQLAMPLSAAQAVADRYAAVVCNTLAVSLTGSMALNLLSSLFFQSFDAVIWEASAILSLLIPLLWTGICMPLTYWFGFHTAQTMGIIAVIPMVYIIKYFEDGAGFSIMAASLRSLVLVAAAATAALFLLSMFISMAGYRRRR